MLMCWNLEVLQRPLHKDFLRRREDSEPNEEAHHLPGWSVSHLVFTSVLF